MLHVTGFKGIGFIGLDSKELGFKQKCLTLILSCLDILS